jgi:hypothetical protein
MSTPNVGSGELLRDRFGHGLEWRDLGFLYSKVRKATWPCLEKP